MSQLRTKIIAYREKNGMASLVCHTGIQESMLNNIVSERHGKHRKNNLDILYDFFRLPKDPWYHENMKKWVKPTESILGEIFRKKRLQLGLSMDDIDARIHVGSRQIARLEAGDSLPSFSSYTITKLLEIYEFTNEEREKIRWFIVVLRDMVNINNALE